MVGKAPVPLTIGVLALQGAVREHRLMLQTLGAHVVEVKQATQLDELDGLVMPGGESTVISKLMHTVGLMQPLQAKIAQGFPVMGTCAGLILLAKQIAGQSETHLSALDICVQRNAFGRQKDSFEQDLDVAGMEQPFPAVFIRAPLILSVDATIEVLATVDEAVVAVKQGHLLGLSFHPELTQDPRFHQLFLNMIDANN